MSSEPVYSAYFLFAVPFSALFYGVFVQIGSMAVVKFRPPYGVSLKVAFMSVVALLVVEYIFDVFVRVESDQMLGLIYLLVFALAAALQAGLCGVFIKRPDDGGAIGYANGVLVVLMTYVLIGVFVAVYSGLTAAYG